MRVALTHGRGRLEGLGAALAALGHDVVRAPLVTTTPLLDEDARDAARALLGLPWRLYASRSAVEAWAAHALAHGDGARLGAIGPGTRRALEAQGGRRVLTGEPATADALAAAVARSAPPGAVGVVQGRRARSTLVTALRAAGREVRVATLYDIALRPWEVGGPVDAVVLASPSAVDALPRLVGDEALLVAIGPTTLAAVAGRGWRGLEAAAPTAEAVVDALRSAPRGAPAPGAEPA